jgi:hypothetical protein
MQTWTLTGNSTASRLLAAAGALLAVISVGAGCASRAEERERGDVIPGEQRVVAHPGGHYELRGEGTAKSPYYWVWKPAGVAVATVPAVPATPTVVVTAPAQRVVAHQEGQYVLAGDGTATSPYYWVYYPHPIGPTAPPPPPPVPRRRQAP